MMFYVIAVIVIIVLAIGLYQKSTNAVCISKKRLDGKTAIVTGGTSGMGLRMAIDYADRGARVIIACPFEDEGKNALRQIMEETDSKEVIFHLLDLSSLDSIRRFVKEVYTDEERLDILMNNAGVGAVSEFVTKDGMSFIMQVNYFGHFLLTLLLLPLLLKTGTETEPARIVNMASHLHYYGTINFSKINDINHWYPLMFYCNSKLCLLLFAHELTKRLKGSTVVVNSVDPGTVATTIFNCYGNIVGGAIRLATFLFLKTPWQGAQTAIHVALDKKAGMMSGQLFRNCKLIRARKTAYDDETAKRLWDESAKLVGLSNEEIELCFKKNQ